MAQNDATNDASGLRRSLPVGATEIVFRHDDVRFPLTSNKDSFRRVHAEPDSAQPGRQGHLPSTTSSFPARTTRTSSRLERSCFRLSISPPISEEFLLRVVAASEAVIRSIAWLVCSTFRPADAHVLPQRATARRMRPDNGCMQQLHHPPFGSAARTGAQPP